MIRIAVTLAVWWASWAEAGIKLQIDGEGRSEKMIKLAAEQALISRGCKVENGSSEPDLLIAISQLSIDRVQGSFNSYGVRLDSAVWTGSVGMRLTDIQRNELLFSSIESVEERQPLGVNGSQDLSQLKTETQLVDAITGRLGSQVVERLGSLLMQSGTCGVPVDRPKRPTLKHYETNKNNHQEIKPSQDLADTGELVTSITTQPHPPSPAKVNQSNPNSPLAKGYRLALVIGNEDYSHIPALRNPSNDANLIAEKLKQAGFELVGEKALLNLPHIRFETAVSEFGKALSRHPGAVGFFYYAGHGIQVNGTNFLVPIDANPKRVAEVSRQAIEVDNLLQEMEDSRSGLNIIVLDACRNNPFGGRGIREGGGGLAQMKAPKGSFIVYATQPGNIAQDGPAGKNSPFARALAETILEPGLDLFGTFNQVGLDVTNRTDGSQQPWISSSPISGRFCFRSCPP